MSAAVLSAPARLRVERWEDGWKMAKDQVVNLGGQALQRSPAIVSRWGCLWTCCERRHSTLGANVLSARSPAVFSVVEGALMDGGIAKKQDLAKWESGFLSSLSAMSLSYKNT